MSIRYSIVGTHFRGKDAEVALKQLKVGDAVMLVREAGNKFDANAVAIYVGEQHIGYIPKGKNAEIARRLDAAIAAMPAVPTEAERMAMDANPPDRIPATFCLSPNSAYPQVQIEEYSSGQS